jgi:hypothetical protein
VEWNYGLSPKLCAHISQYKAQHHEQVLKAPNVLERGAIPTTNVLEESTNEEACKQIIVEWAKEVYAVWKESHIIVDEIAKEFLHENIR